MPFNLEGMLQNISKIKLRGGVVGKVSLTLIVVSLSFAAIAWSVSNIWISAAALAATFALAFPMLWRLISFADKNPQAALLEGAEFLVHEQLRLGTKSHPQIDVDPADRSQPIPIDESATVIENALVPDRQLEAQKLPRGGV